MSIISRLIHTACLAASEAATYSASLELVAMHVCFLDFQETGPPASIKTYPLTDLLLSVWTSPQFESLKHIGRRSSDVGSLHLSYLIPFSIVPLRYRRTWFRAATLFFVGLLLCSASNVAARAMSGLVLSAKYCN